MRKGIALFALCALLLSACSGGTSSAASAAPASGTTATPSAASVAGSDQVFEFKVAHAGSEQTLMHRTWVLIIEEMEKNSQGRIKCTLYPNAQLGGDQQLQEAVQMGDITMTACSTANITAFEPRLSIFAMPFVFPTKEVAYKVLDGDFGKKMLDIMSDQGFKALGYSEAVHYRELSTNKPIATPDDLKGIKIRVMQNPIHMAIWENLGASPTPVSFSELYTALQQKTVDAQENPLELIISQRFYEVQKNVTMTNHIFQCGMFTMNPDVYDSLPDDLKQVVNDAIQKGVDFQRADAEKATEEYLKVLTDAGLTVSELTADQLKLFQDKMVPVYDLIAQEVGQDLVDELLAAVKAAS